MRMIFYEMVKIWSRKIVRIVFFSAFLLNLVYVIGGIVQDNNVVSIGEQKQILNELSKLSPDAAVAHIEALAMVESPETKGVFTSKYEWLHSLVGETKAVVNYKRYIDGIIAAPDLYRQVAIFRTDEYSIRKAERTAELYKPLAGQQLTAGTLRGAGKLFKSSSRLFGMALVMLCSGIAGLFLDRASGAAALDATQYRGGRILSLTKVVTVFLSAVFVELAFFLSDAACFGIAYGFGDLSRPLAEVPGFLSCPYKVSIGGYFLIKPLSELLALLFFGYLAAWLCATLSSIGLIVLLYGLLFAGWGFLYKLISDVSVLRSLKYCNPYCLLVGNGLYDTVVYFNLNGTPIRVVTCVLVVISVFILLLLGGIVLRKGLCPIKVSARRFGGRGRYTSKLCLHEWYCRLIYARGLLICLFALLIAFPVYRSQVEYPSLEEARYAAYMNVFKGPITEATKEVIRNEEKSFEETEKQLNELEDRLFRGELTSEAFEVLSLKHQQKLSLKRAFERAKARVSAIEERDGNIVVYERGYLMLTVRSGSRKLLTGIFVLLTLAALRIEYAMRERTHGMPDLLMSTYRGRGERRRLGRRIDLVIGIVLCIVLYTFEVMSVVRFESLRYLNADACCILEWKHCGRLSIWQYLCLGWILRMILLLITVKLLSGLIERWMTKRHHIHTFSSP